MYLDRSTSLLLVEKYGSKYSFGRSKVKVEVNSAGQLDPIKYGKGRTDAYPQKYDSKVKSRVKKCFRKNHNDTLYISYILYYIYHIIYIIYVYIRHISRYIKVTKK